MAARLFPSTRLGLVPVVAADLLCFFFLFFFSLDNHVLAAAAADTLYPGLSITGDQTLVSKGGTFELGFFSPGNPRNWYLGIWFGKIPRRTVVWVANREVPLDSSASAELRISGDLRGLVLLNGYKTPLWSSPSSSRSKKPNSTVAVLLDTGNFVLKDGGDHDGVFWQSFDHPVDTLLPGQRFGYNRTEGRYWSFSSWRNSEDPSPGLFSAEVDFGGHPQSILLWNKTHVYWTSGLWDGRTFGSAPEMTALPEYDIDYFSSDNASYFTYSKQKVGVLSRSWVDISGQWRCERWSWAQRAWVIFNSLPRDPCDVYSGCGPSGICRSQSSRPCRCPPGFRPRFAVEWGLGNHTGGCVREAQLECGSQGRGKKDVFQPSVLDVSQLPVGSERLVIASAEKCELACLNDCQCMAYSYNGSECLVWKGELLNMKQVDGGGHGGQSGAIYLRLAAAGRLSAGCSGKNVTRITTVASCTVAGVVTLLMCGLWVAIIWRRRRRQLRTQALAAVDLLVPFRYKEMKIIARGFSEKLGEGGFGSVYKGFLPDSSAVAVKCLKNLGHGEKQFRVEVSAMGAVHHINVLRIRGFCCEGNKRLLVYDYMPNGSLDSFLSPKESARLDWNRRYRIALGIARGLAYLHEKCRECIIHCDIKPENILLDANFCPKVADFGMAKLLARDFSRVMTTVRGTTGYLAPEWLLGVHVTPKVDVYSFGMMLFEIISGSRNGVEFEFLQWVTRNVNHDGILNYFPAGGMGWDFPITEEFVRACKVACWCIQDCEDERPSMGQVVQVLEGALEFQDPPAPGLLQRLCGLDSSSASHSQPLSSEV